MVCLSTRQTCWLRIDMLAMYTVDLIQIAILCTILPALLVVGNPRESEKRSLNNYVATSVPYTVHSDNDNIRPDELSLASSVSEKADSDHPSPDMQDCVNQNHCANNVTISSDHASVAEGTFRPYSQDELNKILQKYGGDKDQLEGHETSSSNKVANYYSFANPNNFETSSQSSDADKSKAWNLISYQQQQIQPQPPPPPPPPPPPQHQQQQQQQQQQPPYQRPIYNTNNNDDKNPFNDRTGWVTLEPIAWSSSQVQKWEPNTKPSLPLPSTNSGPWGSSPPQYQQQSNYGGYSERPYKKPTYQYQSNKPWNSKPPQYVDNSFGNQEIITDGQPGYFPSSERPSVQASHNKPWLEQSQSSSYIDSGNRPLTHFAYQSMAAGGGSGPHHLPDRQPAATSSADGDGHWVLLSSTKGYSGSHRQRKQGRSLDLDDEVPVSVNAALSNEKPERPLSARRSIRLTVLPSNEKTLTSHNGMIEVESSGHTVDESHRQHLARMMRFENSTDTAMMPTIRSSSYHGIPAKVEAVARPAERRSHLSGAVGAGTIPATMAMILPMLLGRRKRSVEPRVLILSSQHFGQPGTVIRYHKMHPAQGKIM